jgi:glucosamine-6-phosphate deaminase
MAVKRFIAGSMKVEVYPTKPEAGAAAAQAAAHAMLRLKQDYDQIGVIFATGASQVAMLETLTTMPGLPWDKVHGFHLDEYVGIDANHPASFRRYLRERLTQRVPIASFLPMDGSSPDPERVCRDYAAQLTAADPKLCLLGIGENGHLAFNDPGEADFQDKQTVKVVNLDEACRQQQLAEGWFPTLADVPERALSLTIPAILRVPKLIASVPGPRKAEIMRRTLEEPISTDCPATILRDHPDVTVYLDSESAAQLGSWLEKD